MGAAGDELANGHPRWLPITRRLAAGAAVLVYHGVLPTERRDSPGSMHVPVDRLMATIRALQRVAQVVPLREIIARHNQHQSTKGLVAITFDDAYHSVHTEALPFLLAEHIPSTLFVVTDRARTGKAYWWDRVDALYEKVTAERWRVFEDELGLPQSFRTGPVDMGPLRPLRQWILAEHRGVLPLELERALDLFERETGHQTTQRPLTFAQLDAIARNPLVDVGAHTLSHPVLPLLSDQELRREIGESIAELRTRYPSAVLALAPPFGLYDERTIRIAREEGVRACLTLEGTQVDDRSSTALIPRFGMTARHQPWKAVLYAFGCWYRVRPRRGASHEYPALPSAGT
jgi:peptidoglycan/xylan/chitin deacetylase (PgdA/CDA1 family)